MTFPKSAMARLKLSAKLLRQRHRHRTRTETKGRRSNVQVSKGEQCHLELCTGHTSIQILEGVNVADQSMLSTFTQVEPPP